MTSLVLAPRRIIRYFSLRPALSWSLACITLFTALLFAVRLRGLDDALSRDEFTSLELMTMAMPKSVTQPDINVSNENTEDQIEEKKEEDTPLRFGDESGDFNDLFETSRAPMPIFASLPQYPPSMKKQGIEGVVVIEIGVDETGRLLYGVVIRSLGREFDQAAVNWVRSIRFRPGMDRQGTPIRCRVRLPIRFRLED